MVLIMFTPMLTELVSLSLDVAKLNLCKLGEEGNLKTIC